MISTIPTILTFLAALSVAGVAEWFSVVGIMSIYAGAPFHAGLIMGIVLGFAKLVTVSWLYRNWKEADWKLRAPMMYFTVALMVATSIGVFGFLTKAHLEQGASTIDNSAKVERLDQQIAREKSTITDNEKVITQLDTAINAYMGKDRTDKALSVRKLQAPQRKQLRDEIDTAQKRIDSFDEEKLKLTSEVRALQLEVGPIRYIAELFYGTEGSESAKVESAVKLFTLLIVSTLDPLAVVLLIAANHTLLRLQNGKKDKLLPEIGVQSKEDNLTNDTNDKENGKTQTEQAHIPELSNYADSATTVPDEIQIQSPEMDAILQEQDTSKDRGLVESSITPDIFTQIEEENEKNVVNSEEVVTGPKSAPPPIIVSPPVSRIGLGLSGSPSVTAAVEDKIPVQDKPAVLNHGHDSTVLREMLGRHFIPKQINEKEEQTVTKTSSIGNNETPATWPAQSNNAEEIQEMVKTGTEEIQTVYSASNTSEITDSRDKSSFPVTPNKYPVSLSWLKEFKGN